MSELPVLSVIVPVRNEAEHIVPCLQSILADAPVAGLEVLVVDGESDDGTASRVAALAQADSRIRLLTNPERFVPQAMNRGLAAARAPFIGRMDGHCRVEQGYFAGCLERLRWGDDDCVGGSLINVGQGRLWGEAVAAAQASPVGVGSARFRTGGGGEALVDTLAFGVYRREVFDRIGVFDEFFVRNQDDELNLRLVRAGGRIRLLPWLRVRYFVRDSPRRLARQYFQYGYWKWFVIRKHGRLASVRQLAPSLFLAAVTLALGAAVVTSAGRMVLALILGSYMLILALEGLRQWRRRGAPPLRTALAIAILHGSYGAGLWRAVLDSLLGRHRRGRTAPTALSR